MQLMCNGWGTYLLVDEQPGSQVAVSSHEISLRMPCIMSTTFPCHLLDVLHGIQLSLPLAPDTVGHVLAFHFMFCVPSKYM
jgi:hypothetical protein